MYIYVSYKFSSYSQRKWQTHFSNLCGPSMQDRDSPLMIAKFDSSNVLIDSLCIKSRTILQHSITYRCFSESEIINSELCM